MAIINKPTAYFQTTLYSGTGSSQSITNTGNSDLQPDWVWVKSRSTAVDHELFDSVRGTGVALISNGNYAESTGRGVNSFDSDGFSLVHAQGATNTSGRTYAAWQWKAGTSFTNDASGTGIGSIDSAGSVNTTSGFSIISYTGTGSVGTVAHGLGAVPKMILFKNRSRASNWIVYHEALGNTKNLYLDATNAEHDRSDTFNDTSPTSSVFTVGTADLNINTESIIAYCFAEKQGYSKISSYVGNGNADGPFIYTGFKPAYVMIKRTDAANNWMVWDNKRIGYNVDNNELYPNETAAEGDDDRIDLLSNGFKWRSGGATNNASGSVFIYMAFAEQPFVSNTASGSVPVTAR